MMGLMLVLLTFYWGAVEYGFSAMGVGVILGKGCGIQV